jgi:hypothetical protein
MYFMPSVRETVRQFVHEHRAGWLQWNGTIMFMSTPVILNAALNPCLYLLRMPQYREQLLLCLTAVRQRISETVSEIRERN